MYFLKATKRRAIFFPDHRRRTKNSLSIFCPPVKSFLLCPTAEGIEIATMRIPLGEGGGRIAGGGGGGRVTFFSFPPPAEDKLPRNSIPGQRKSTEARLGNAQGG